MDTSNPHVVDQSISKPTTHVESRTPISRLDPTQTWGVGVAVFLKDISKTNWWYPHLLLVKRAAVDEVNRMTWEIPSGRICSGDVNIWASVARVLHKETSLRAIKILKQLPDKMGSTVNGRETVQLNFVVEVENEAAVRLRGAEYTEYRWMSKSVLEWHKTGDDDGDEDNSTDSCIWDAFRSIEVDWIRYDHEGFRRGISWGDYISDEFTRP
ncbi:MAG: hypothetical protein Q9159_000900 [Coniocarpon cinnabarinum]